MKTKNVILLTLFLFSMHFIVLSQDFIPGQLFVKVADKSGIPTISIDPPDTMVIMSNFAIQEIFQQNHVFRFEKVFPSYDYNGRPDNYGLKNIYKLSCNCDEEQLMTQILDHSDQMYTYVEKIPIDKIVYTPNDYHLQDQIPVSGPDTALNFIRAESAWEYTHGDSSVLIGIIDAKIFKPWNHEDIIGKIAHWDTIGGSQGDFHGLFVSGCAAANTDNGIGKSSIGFNCRLIFSSHMGHGYPNTLDSLSQMGAKVINLSWGHSSYPSATYQDAINTVTENGTLIVAAAANDSSYDGNFGYYFYPASYKNVLSVTSIDYNYKFLTWDNSIPYCHHNYNDSVDICAPGYHVMGLWDSCESCYKRSSGTSFASPIVAGTAGLIFSINPCLSPAQVVNILQSTSNDIIYTIPENYPFIGKLGSGALDAGAAVKLAYDNYRPQDYVIHDGESITWNESKYVDHYIEIESGGTLTVHGDVFLNKNAVINVHNGGCLFVNGGRLTSNCSCSLWSGINVWGNRNLGQFSTNQGKVSFSNGAVVENAIYAVRTIRPIPNYAPDSESYELDHTGGIIYAENTIFRNNVKAIWFLPYENLRPDGQTIVPNVSYIRKCLFETTRKFNDSTRHPVCFVDLNGVRGIQISGCTFRNTSSYFKKRDHIGNGINSVNSSFFVIPGCQDENCEQIVKGSFQNLNYGIKALGANPVKPAFIDRNIFSGNYTGVYLKGMVLSTVIRNNFWVKPSDSSKYDTIGGLYLDQCTSYQVEENTFTSNYSLEAMQSKAIRLGLVVNNSGIYDNRIYNNRFDSLNVGILAENRNRSTYGDYGLELKCNDFIYPNKYDIAVTRKTGTSNMGIRNTQGSNGTDSKDPAGNTFSYTLNANVPYSDFYNECENLVYWYHYHNGGANVKPEHYSATVNPQFNQNNSHAYIKNTCCPSSFSPGGGTSIMDLIANMNHAEGNIDSISGLLALLVDGGDTPGTDEFIQSSTPGQTIEVRNDLLSKTPYLSDSVMLSAATKEDVLPPAIIAEILSANPQAAKSDTVIQALENRTLPLTEEQWAAIDQGLFVIGAKETLETKLSGFLSEYHEALKKIIIHYRNDSLNQAAGDSIVWYLNKANSLSAKYMLAFEYFEKGDTMSAENTLNNITSAFNLSSADLSEHGRYLSYFELLKQLKREGKSITETDSAQTQILYSLLNNSDGLVSGYARNVLLSKGIIDYREPYILPEEGYKLSAIRHRNFNEKYESSRMKVYPNPARDYIIIEYTLNAEPENAVIAIYDGGGKTIRSQSLNSTRDFLVIPLSGIPSGNYICSLRVGGKPLQNVRFVVIK